jgi:hypothetical protein
MQVDSVLSADGRRPARRAQSRATIDAVKAAHGSRASQVRSAAVLEDGFGSILPSAIARLNDSRTARH